MKRDGRTLDHATLESIRKMAVQRVREGERPSDVIAEFRHAPLHDLRLAQGGTTLALMSSAEFP